MKVRGWLDLTAVWTPLRSRELGPSDHRRDRVPGASPGVVVTGTPTALVVHLVTAIDRTGPIGRDSDVTLCDQWIAVASPPRAMHLAPCPTVERPIASVDRAGTLRHLGSSLQESGSSP